MKQRRSIAELETVAVTVPEHALEAYEAALSSACDTVGFFRDQTTGEWRVEGVRTIGHRDDALTGALALAAVVTGVSPVLDRSATEAEGWLGRTYSAFPEQRIGRRFAVRGTHLTDPVVDGRITLTVDAGVAFGSGEHGSTRGCLIALEMMAHRRPRRILDLGTGSGILAMAAAKLLHRKVRATDIEPWSVRVTRENAKLNRIAPLIHPRLADGWHDPVVRSGSPYDLVFGNILARPLCSMAKSLAEHLAPGGTAILAGLLTTQARAVLAAHRRQGLRLERMVTQGPWSTLIIRRTPGRA
jgi:ribosomal protein L11 methyltransferase